MWKIGFIFMPDKGNKNPITKHQKQKKGKH